MRRKYAYLRPLFETDLKQMVDPVRGLIGNRISAKLVGSMALNRL